MYSIPISETLIEIKTCRFCGTNFPIQIKTTNFMQKYHLFSMKKNILFQHPRCVLIAVNNGDYRSVMNVNSTSANAMRRGKISFLFILLISCLRYIIKIFGGAIVGIHSVMEKILIFQGHFLNNSRSSQKTRHTLMFSRNSMKIANILQVLGIRKIAILHLILISAKIACILL